MISPQVLGHLGAILYSNQQKDFIAIVSQSCYIYIYEYMLYLDAKCYNILLMQIVCIPNHQRRYDDSRRTWRFVQIWLSVWVTEKFRPVVLGCISEGFLNFGSGPKHQPTWLQATITSWTQESYDSECAQFLFPNSKGRLDGHHGPLRYHVIAS